MYTAEELASEMTGHEFIGEWYKDKTDAEIITQIKRYESTAQWQLDSGSSFINTLSQKPPPSNHNSSDLKVVYPS